MVSDDQAEEVQSQRFGREGAREAFKSGPREVIPYLEELRDHPSFAVPDPSQIDEVVRVKKEQLRDGVLARWRELRAVEVAIGVVGDAFGGEDPAVPDVRAAIDGCRKELEKLRGEAERFVGPFALQEPTHEELDLVRRLVARA